MTLDQIIDKIKAERLRHINLPGSEWDSKHSPGEWVAMATHYLTDNVKRNGVAPNSEDFTDGLVKAAAVIIAALEHVDIMVHHNHLK